MAHARQGLMLVLSSPSGAGKTTVSRALLDTEPDLELSVSVTTRPPRPNETSGIDYTFVEDDEFSRRAAAGDFLEFATVFGRRYGTPRAPVEKTLAGGRDVLFDIDWQGTQQLKSGKRSEVVSVFIMPPSMAALEQRLRMRAQDPDKVVRERMARAGEEMSHWEEYDYVLVNDDLDNTVASARAILAAERLKRVRQSGLKAFVRGLR